MLRADSAAVIALFAHAVVICRHHLLGLAAPLDVDETVLGYRCVLYSKRCFLYLLGHSLQRNVRKQKSNDDC